MATRPVAAGGIVGALSKWQGDILSVACENNAVNLTTAPGSFGHPTRFVMSLLADTA